jgi:hypothetical protein
MASSNEPSNTLFDISRLPPPEDRRPVIVLDQTFSSAKIAGFLSSFGEWRVELHGKHFASNCPDHVWIPECAKRGWIILSCDKAIRRSPQVCAAVEASHAQVFFMGRGGRRGEDYMAIIGTARHRILRIAKNNAGPFFARIHQTAVVELVGLADDESKSERTQRKYRPGAAFKRIGIQTSPRRRRRGK